MICSKKTGKGKTVKVCEFFKKCYENEICQVLDEEDLSTRVFLQLKKVSPIRFRQMHQLGY